MLSIKVVLKLIGIPGDGALILCGLGNAFKTAINKSLQLSGGELVQELCWAVLFAYLVGERHYNTSECKHP